MSAPDMLFICLVVLYWILLWTTLLFMPFASWAVDVLFAGMVVLWVCMFVAVCLQINRQDVIVVNEMV